MQTGRSLTFHSSSCCVTTWLAFVRHRCRCTLIHAAYLSHSVFFHTLTNTPKPWHWGGVRAFWRSAKIITQTKTTKGGLSHLTRIVPRERAVCVWLSLFAHKLEKVHLPHKIAARISVCIGTHCGLVRRIRQYWQLFKPLCLFAYPHSQRNWLFPEPFFKQVWQYFHWLCHC